MTREQTLNDLRTRRDVSVLIIGAGINGIGTFRDLALQGIDVLLVDKGDFGSGASAASSHMLHGGIRYLENGEFRLVREALTERNLMLKNAPHYSKPLPTTIPIFSWFSGIFNAPLKFLRLREKPGERGAVVIKIGLILYDIFARAYRVMPTHTMHSRQKSLELYPKFNPEIVCTATYYDAFMPYPERICLELVLDTQSAEARALNYVSAVGAHVDTVMLRDEITGETFNVKPKLVVNAAGPWIDFVNRAMGQVTGFIGGTKGSHLIVDHPELYRACNGHEIFFENNDGRIVLILPYLGKVMIGTTDIRINDPEQAICTEEEVDYMLNLVKKVFPSITLDRSHILFRFSGVRPLPTSTSGFAGNISRDHSIQSVEPSRSGLTFPIYSLVGGKWTTFRAFAEQTADKVLARLGRTRKTSTVNLSIGGGRGYPHEENAKQAWIDRVQQKTGLPTERIVTLFDRYGTRAEQIAVFIAASADTPLSSAPEYSRREMMFLAQQEYLIHLDDLILRRTLLAWLGYASPELLSEVSDILGETLGWSEDRKHMELERTAKILHEKHGITIALPVQ
jgi:glycerol-3-phosphate dehydrogenase